MKKLATILVLTLVISVIGFGVSVGRLFNEMTSVSVPIITKFDVEISENLYIKSDIPLEIKPSDELQRVEIYTKIEGLNEKDPSYSVTSEVRGETTYIDIQKDRSNSIGQLAWDIEEYATLYLPRQQYNSLKVEEDKGAYRRDSVFSRYINNKEYDIDLRGIDINDIDIAVSNSRILLDGYYENINIDIHSNSWGDSVEVASINPANITLNGPVTYVGLTGNYKDIIINKAVADVNINASSGDRIIIKGGNDSVNMRIEGPFDVVDINGNGQNVEVINTVAPERMSFNGDIDKVKVQLPGDISGFKTMVTGITQEETVVHTEFPVEINEESMTSSRMVYGDGLTNILIDDFKGEFYLLQGLSQ